ncbi:MAG TPA: copper resistance protein CopC [Actinomycetota bacterium]|nr:copper resistance protein CopC [Actinomycetota bacterium]
MARRRGIPVAVAAVAVALAAIAPAWGHGEKAKSDPDDGDRLPRPPQSVAVTLTEAPTDDAQLEVTDGCGDPVVAGVTVRGETVEGRIAGGSPGRWHARYRVISAVDGHPTDGRWDFDVAGERDCGGRPGDDDDGDDDGDDGGTASPDPEPTLADDGGPDDGGGAFPTAAVAGGALALVVLALVARRFGAR